MMRTEMAMHILVAQIRREEHVSSSAERFGSDVNSKRLYKSDIAVMTENAIIATKEICSGLPSVEV